MPKTTDIVAAEGLNPRVALAIESALTRYFKGLATKKEALSEEEGCSEGTYYTWRKEHPDLIQAIEDQARLKGLKAQRGEDIAFEARQKRRSHFVQEYAMEILEDVAVMEAMHSIVLGETRLVRQGEEEKYITAYPRDQIEALRRIQEIARGGTLPEPRAEALEFLDRVPVENERWGRKEKEEEEEKSGTTLEEIGFGASTRFTKITAETADGRKLTAEVSQEDVIEGESHEL